MIQILLMIAIIFLSILMIVTVFNILTGPRLSKAPYSGRTPKVSLLIPARDEAHNIDRCLTDLIGQDYPDYEIIVLDDHSKDNTADIVRGYANQYHHVKLLAGKSLPSGWTGKNWACQQLSEAAGGGFFIFTDADNRYATNAIKNTMGWMQKLNLGFLSAFPQQFTGTLMEKLVIPVIDIFVYGTLPLWMTYYLRSPLFAAANGQWLAFTREAYHRIGGHQGVRNQVVEDVEISRLVKRSGIKMLTTAGTGVVFGRMYRNAKEVVDGFTKNLFGLTGFHQLLFWNIIFAVSIAFIMPYLLVAIPATQYAAIAVSMNVLLRGLLAIRYKHPFWISIAFHPVATAVIIFIGIKSFISVMRGSVHWKGRQIKVLEAKSGAQ